jgi:hypothetical protein
MRESCTSGSVRGARGNSRPYRNRCCLVLCVRPLVAQSVALNPSCWGLLIRVKRTEMLRCGYACF